MDKLGSEGLPGDNPILYVSGSYFDPRLSVPCLVFGIVGIVVIANLDKEWYWTAAVIVGAFTIPFALLRKAFVDLDNKVVREEVRLLGGKLPAQRVLPLSEFEAVAVRHHKDSDSEDWMVGLQHRCGRQIWLRRYPSGDTKHSKPGHAADLFAMALAEKTRLPIKDYYPLKPGAWLRSVFAR